MSCLLEKFVFKYLQINYIKPLETTICQLNTYYFLIDIDIVHDCIFFYLGICLIIFYSHLQSFWKLFCR